MPPTPRQLDIIRDWCAPTGKKAPAMKQTHAHHELVTKEPSTLHHGPATQRQAVARG